MRPGDDRRDHFPPLRVHVVEIEGLGDGGERAIARFLALFQIESRFNVEYQGPFGACTWDCKHHREPRGRLQWPRADTIRSCFSSPTISGPFFSTFLGPWGEGHADIMSLRRS